MVPCQPLGRRYISISSNSSHTPLLGCQYDYLTIVSNWNKSYPCTLLTNCLSYVSCFMFFPLTALSAPLTKSNWDKVLVSVHPSVSSSIRAESFPGILWRRHGRNGLKFCMRMYPEPSSEPIVLYFGYSLKIFFLI